MIRCFGSSVMGFTHVCIEFTLVDMGPSWERRHQSEHIDNTGFNKGYYRLVLIMENWCIA